MQNLTILIVTFSTEKKLIINCLNSIHKKFKVIIIENSKKFKYKNFFLKKYSNIQIFCTGKNLGYGGGNNFGLKKVTTKFALILNPDTVLDNHFYLNYQNVIKNKDFSLMGCQYKFDKIFMPGGFFDKKKDQSFKKKFYILKNNNLNTVEWISGCAILVNLKKFQKRNIFDENFFLYFEEYDLCRQLLKKGEKILLSKKLKVHHLGYKSSSSQKKDFKEEAKKLRDWHWMWSYFYYHKKNFGYLYAVYVSFGKLLKALIKSIFFSLLLNNEKKYKYLYRFLGLISSIFGSSSYYRGKYFK